MIRALVTAQDSTIETGGLEVIEAWQANPSTPIWIDIQGELTPELKTLLRELGCDDLAITDSARQRHPPKVENFDNNGFILFRGIASITDKLELIPQQIGIWVGSNYLITVHRGTSVSVEHFLERKDIGRLLDTPALLAVKLLYFASGRYLEVLLETEERIGDLEDALLEEQSEAAMKELVSYRTRLRKLRRVFSYHLKIAEFVLNEDGDYLGAANDETQHMRRDLYDRCERLWSLSTLYYELCGDLIEGYISLNSYQLNNTMKILTIITAIFVPLSFMAGMYGMNFEYMPELKYRYAYFILLGAMVSVAGLMVYLFKRNKWL